MPKRPVSVTLELDNLTWLRARATSGKWRSLSEALDDIVTAARVSTDGNTVRSVVGTIDINSDDLSLERADEFVRSQFAASLSRPLLRQEAPASYSAPTRRSRKAKAATRRRA